jgi:hypothetical protein
VLRSRRKYLIDVRRIIGWIEHNHIEEALRQATRALHKFSAPNRASIGKLTELDIPSDQSGRSRVALNERHMRRASTQRLQANGAGTRTAIEQLYIGYAWAKNVK